MAEAGADSMSASTGEDDGVKETLELIEARIIHSLEICPALTSSQIHMSLGTSTPSMLWRPVLMKLVADKKVTKVEFSTKTPLDRNQSYTIYHLPSHPYKLPTALSPSPSASPNPTPNSNSSSSSVSANA